jgi:hypothetical protein
LFHRKKGLCKSADLKLVGPYVNGTTIYLLDNSTTGSSISVGVNKPALLTVVVIDATTGDSVHTLVEDTLWQPGAKLFAVSWKGNIGGRAADDGNEYQLQVRAVAADGFGSATVTAPDHIRVVVSDSIPQKDPSEFNLSGTTYKNFMARTMLPLTLVPVNSKFVATASGRYSPDVPVTVPVQFKGKNEGQTYPSENFAIGIRRSFDRIKLGYAIYARSFFRDVTEDGLFGRWESPESIHRWRVDKLYGVVTVNRDSAVNSILRTINYPGVTGNAQNNSLYLNDYYVAFFLLDGNGKSLGAWNGVDKISFISWDGGNDSCFDTSSARGQMIPIFVMIISNFVHVP